MQESLRFRLQGTVGDIGSWGHEYVRYIVVLQNQVLACLVMVSREFGLSHSDRAV